MANTYDYTFQCAALDSMLSSAPGPADNVLVTHWQGTEGVSRPYRFEVTFAVAQRELDLDKLLDETATLTTTMPNGGTRQWHGIVTFAAEAGTDEVYRYYQVVLEPRLARLRNIYWSDIYLKHDLADLIKQLLAHAGLDRPYSTDAQGYDYRIAATQLAQTRREFVCQYEETCLDFLMRKLEYYGVYFWFEQGAKEESLVFANDVDQQPANADTAVYYPKGALDPDSREIALLRLNRRVGLPPKTVVLHSSQEHANTTLTLASQAHVPIPAPGRALGELHSVADDFERVDDDASVSGAILARWRAQELACRRMCVHGEAGTPGVRPGHFLTISEYQRGANPRQYYVTEVEHEGTQSLETTPQADGQAYRAIFVAVPRWLDPAKPTEALQYRPPRVTQVPLVTRLINGFIDVGDPSQPKRSAQPDPQGRYKVRFLFARQRYDGERNSAFVRMATPYAGGASAQGLTNAGMHFPLREGTEVLLAFLKGNPDRPVIVAALPNIEAPSPVTATNPNDHVITTPGGNSLVMSDGERSNKTEPSSTDEQFMELDKLEPYIELSSPIQKSSLTLGKNKEADNGWMLKTDKHGELFAGESLLVEVPGHYRVAAGGGGVNNFLGSEAKDMPSGISAGQKGGIVIENFLGAKIESVEAITVGHFIGAKAELNEAAVLETTLGVKGSVEAVKAYELNFAEKAYTHDSTSFLGNLWNWVGNAWHGVMSEKKEEAISFETTALKSYQVRSPFIEMTATSTYEVSSTIVGMTASYVYKLEAPIVKISTDAMDLKSTIGIKMTAATLQAEVAAGGIVFRTAGSFACDAPLVRLG